MSNSIRLVAVALLGLSGAVSCSPTGLQCPPVGFPRQPTTANPPANAEHETTSREPLQRLISAVEALECGPNGLQPRASSAALSKLADTLLLQPGLPAPTLQRVRWAAEHLASLSSSSTGPGHAPPPENDSNAGEGQSAEMVRAGLVAAQQTLLAQSGPVKYQTAVAMLGYALAGMQSEHDVGDQCQSEIHAFRAATDAVFVGLDGEPPFSDKGLDVAESLTFPSMRAGIDPARAVVAALGSAKWPHARDRAGEALQLFAATLSAADCHHRLKSKTSSLRFQAERLTQSDALSLGQSRWIKRGLTDALDALDTLNPNAQVSPPAGKQAEAAQEVAAAAPWARAARAAVANIAADQLFGLQRTPIQDGFRATLDALAIAAASAPACQS